MKNIIVVLTLFSSINLCAQDLNCKDFKEGLFVVLADSIYSESSKYSRKKSKQIEWGEKGDSIYVNVKYLDDCNWVLTYDSDLNKLDELEEFINASGGMYLETKEIRGDTLFYNGILKNDTLPFSQPGAILKMKSKFK